MPQTVQVVPDDNLGRNRAKRRRQKHNERRQQIGQRPALIAINDAADHLGIARSTFYAKFLSDLETVRIGRRRMVVMEALDRLVKQLRETATR